MVNKLFFIIILFFLACSASKADSKLYIFYVNYSCNDCFKTIKFYTDSIKKSKIIDSVFVITRVRNKVLAKKIINRDISKLFQNYQVSYEYIDEEDPWPPNNLKGGLFGKYNVSICPAILLIIEGNETFVSYELLHKYNFNLITILQKKNIINGG